MYLHIILSFTIPAKGIESQSSVFRSHWRAVLFWGGNVISFICSLVNLFTTLGTKEC